MAWGAGKSWIGYRPSRMNRYGGNARYLAGKVVHPTVDVVQATTRTPELHKRGAFGQH